MTPKYRLVTRSDFDGLVCAVLLRKLDLIDEIKFVHPKDMQDGKVPISDRDITTNLPYVEGAHLAFDHHSSETLRVGQHDNHVIDPHAASAARVVYRHYGGKERFPDISDEMMDAVDKADSAQFSMQEILDPSGWVLLNYVMDARTGLGRFRDFRISNYDLMMKLIDACIALPVADILRLPDVAERVDLYDAVPLGVLDRVGEDGGSAGLGCRFAKGFGEIVAVEDVVAEDEAAAFAGEELLADEEGLGEAVGRGLDGVLDGDAPAFTGAEQLFVARSVGGR